MNYRGLILSLIGLVAVITGIFFAVRGLRRKAEEPEVIVIERTKEDSRFPLLDAVPSDAAAIFCFDGGRDAVNFLTDSASVFPPLFSAQGTGIPARYIKAASTRKLTVSLHYAGGFVPLCIIDVADADSARVAYLSLLADTLEVRHRLVPEREILLASSSETLLSTSERYLAEGYTILDNRELLAAASTLQTGNAAFLSMSAAGNLVKSLLTKEYSPYSNFLAKSLAWIGFQLPSRGATRSEGFAVTYENGFYQRILTGMTPGSFNFRDVIPAEAVSVVALATEDIGRYFILRRKWVDASGRLSKYKDANSAARKSLGKTAEQYATEQGLKEIASALLPSGERLVALRYEGRAVGPEQETGYQAGYALSMLFGDMFRPAGDSLKTICRGGWKFVGSPQALSWLGGKTLKSVAVSGDLIPDKGAFILYDSGTNPSRVLASPYALPARKLIKSAAAASSFTATPEEDGVRYAIDYRGVQKSAAATPAPVVHTPAATPSSTPSQAGGASVIEYPVKDLKTGVERVFFQTSDGYIGLRDASGKQIARTAFAAPVCSRVREIDYYGTGKTQYLFASGSRLYLMDGKGMILPSFDVDLGRRILVGPDLFRFSGDYAVMVLHEDNSLALYTLEGEPWPGWKDIRPSAKVFDLPELITVDGEDFWKVSLSSGDRLWRFKGGRPLSASKTRKLLKKTVQKPE